MIHSTYEHDRFIDLVTRRFHGSLSDRDYECLEAILLASAEARRAYGQWINDAATLRRWANSRVGVESPISTPHPSMQSRDVARSRSHALHFVYAIAASLMFSAAAIAVYIFVGLGSPTLVPADSSSIATLIESSGTSAFVNDDIALEGGEYGPGIYSIDSGSAEFIFTSGVTASLTGRTRLTIHGDMAASLDEGSATFHCPPGASGYTVHLPGGARAVDLGTEFTVHAYSDGRSVVAVRTGRVDVRASEGPAHPLTAGRIAALDDSGRIAEVWTGDAVEVDPRLVALYRLTNVDQRSGTLANHAFAHRDRFAATLGDGINPATVPTWTDGPTADAGALRLASVSGQHFRIDDFADASIADGLTIAAWVKLDRPSPWHLIAAQWEISPQRQGFVHFAIHDGRLALHWVTDDRPLASHEAVRTLIADERGTVTPDDGWVHIAMTVRAGGNAALYRNGVAVARDRFGADRLPTTAAAPLVFAGKQTPDGIGFDGAIGPIAVFNDALTPEAIARLYSIAHQGPPPHPSDEEADAETE